MRTLASWVGIYLLALSAKLLKYGAGMENRDSRKLLSLKGDDYGTRQ